MSKTTAKSAPPTPLAGQCTPSRFVNVSINVSPGTQIQAGMTVQLAGTALGVQLFPSCETEESDVPFHWGLSFQAPGGPVTNIISQLNGANTLNSSFVATDEGTYRATLTGGNARFGTETVEVVITASAPPPQLINVSGHVTFLRVSDVGGGFGPANDFIDVEAVTQLDTQADKSFGFQLRNDKNRPARQGMFDLLRDAFDNQRLVSLECLLVPGKNNGIIVQVTLGR